MRIGGGLGVFKKLAAPKTDSKVNNNPFASNPFGLAFKGKLQGSDLFEKTTASDGVKNTILNRGKMAVSAAVSSLTQIKNTFREKMGPIIVFAQQTSEKIAKIADTVSNFKASDLKLSNLIRDEKYPNISKQAKKILQKHPEVSDLEGLWHASVAHA